MRAAGRSQLLVGMILAWSVIYLIHVFVFPVYQASGGGGSSGGEAGGGESGAGGSIGALEAALCGRGRAGGGGGGSGARRASARPRCPPAGIVTARPSGRTGNLISEYASLWAVSRRTGLEAYAPPCLLAPLRRLFANLTVPSLARVRRCRARWSSVARELRAWNGSTAQALALPPRTLLADEIVPRLAALRRELALAPELRGRAQVVLRALAAAAGPPRPGAFVGLHVRRTDYARYLRRTLRAPPAPLGFYLQAMRHFERRLREPLFVVVSDEPRWCERRLTRGRGGRSGRGGRGGRVALAAAAAAGSAGEEGVRLDLAVLAECNHTIFDYGTFGLWGALLAGGEAVVYRVSAQHAAVRVARALPAWRLIPPDPAPPAPTPSLAVSAAISAGDYGGDASHYMESIVPKL